MAKSTTARATRDALARLQRWARHPAIFAAAVLGHELWDMPLRIMDAISRPRARVYVKGCHASSKTFSAAEIALAWLLHSAEAKVITTAPTWTQVKREVWEEIHRAHDAALVRIFEKLNQTEIPIGPENYAIGISTNSTERMQGFHGEVLFIIDEGPGVPAYIWDAIEGAAAGGDVRVLALGNPTIPSGRFYDGFTGTTPGVTAFTIDAFETPNLIGLTEADLLVMPEHELDRSVLPYLISRRWVRDRLLEWGTESPLYQAKVRARFPRQAQNALYPIDTLEAARAPAVPADPGGPVIAGVDVAAGGADKTACTVRTGGVILGHQAWGVQDARHEVAGFIWPYHLAGRLAQVNVDEVGVGSYFASYFQNDLGLPVLRVNVGRSARNERRFANLKAEIYWAFREWLLAGQVSGLRSDDAYNQLAGIRYNTNNARQLIAIEDKEAHKKRTGKSPDDAEATILAFIEPVEQQYHAPRQPEHLPKRQFAIGAGVGVGGAAGRRVAA